MLIYTADKGRPLVTGPGMPRVVCRADAAKHPVLKRPRQV